MALLIYAGDRDASRWVDELKLVDDSLDIRVYPDYGSADEIKFAITWPYPDGLWSDFANLKAISSIGAGVSHILDDSTLSSDIPVLKLVDDKLNQSMWEYLLATVSHHTMGLHLYKELQSQKHWRELPAKSFADTTVGILGLGSIGSFVAKRFSALGFNVVGFANTPKEIDGIEVTTLCGASDEIMGCVDVWISILPLTTQTVGIFDKGFFSRVKKGCTFINVGRGAQVVESDLIKALDSGILSSAYLDVFSEEPLPSSHIFWVHPKVHVTPHIASITDPSSVAEQIVKNYHNVSQGLSLSNVVSRSVGY